MSASDNLRKDAEELIRLSELTESANVKRFLMTEADKLKKLAEVEEKKLESITQKSASLSVRPGVTISKIVNYGWDQSDKFLKFYVSFNGVQDFPSENITTDFSAKTFELHIVNAEKRTDNVLAINNLLHEIKPSESHFKVKKDMVVLFLRKSSSQNWSYITEAEKKAKEPKGPKLDNKEEDPSSSLMTLMKQMYDDGDDDMKRTIAKAWTEARDKKTPEDMLQ